MSNKIEVSLLIIKKRGNRFKFSVDFVFGVFIYLIIDVGLVLLLFDFFLI